jgi:hypothetical protein
MGLGFGRDYEAEVPRRRAGLTRFNPGNIERSAEASGARHKLLSPFQETARRNPAGDGRDKRRRVARRERSSCAPDGSMEGRPTALRS